MSLLVPLDTTPDFAARDATAAPERLLEGAPFYKTWELDTALAEAARWGKIRTGIWESTAGKTISIKGETFEFCHILSGRCEIRENGGETHVFGSGDSFVMKPGFTGSWNTLETVKKIFVIAS